MPLDSSLDRAAGSAGSRPPRPSSVEALVAREVGDRRAAGELLSCAGSRPAVKQSSGGERIGRSDLVAALEAETRTVVVLDTVLSEVDDPRPLLSAVYANTAPGATVIIADRDDRVGEGKRRSRRDVLTTAMFAEGFVAIRTHSAKDKRFVAVAHRGAELPPSQRPTTLSIVLPVFNERETFRKVMEQLMDKEIPGVTIDVVVVESNSTDGTRDEAVAFEGHDRVNVVLEDRPNGKGHAVRTGFAHATGELVMIQDADLEYDMDDYESVFQPLRSFEASFVLGARTRTAGARFGVRRFEKQVLTGMMMNVGNVIFLRLFNSVYRQQLADPFTMYKAFRRDCLSGLALECNRFDLDWELTGKLIRAGYSPVEIPVSYESRSFTEGKKVSVLRDPLSWVVAALKYRFARLDV